MNEDDFKNGFLLEGTTFVISLVDRFESRGKMSTT